MLSNETLSSALRAVADAAQKPVLLILLIILATAVVLAGTLIAECFTERLRLKAKLPKLVDAIRAGDAPLDKIIAQSGLLKRQKASLMELTRHPELTSEIREALALEILRTERAHYDGIVRISDMVDLDRCSVFWEPLFLSVRG